jgi:hypothetical protein
VAQFYMLSVLANLVAGLSLAGDYLVVRVPWLVVFKKVRENRSARTTIGICALVIGVIKLFVLSPGEHILIIGDLLPALTGVALGATLLAEVHHVKVEQAGEQIRKISKTALTYRVPVGITGIVVALLHFLFPSFAVL